MTTSNLFKNISREEHFSLENKKIVMVKKHFLVFRKWDRKPILNTYGNKVVVNLNGEPVFTELAVLKLFQSQGWSGVWVDSYRKKYRIGLPGISEPVVIPKKQEILIDSIRKKTGLFGGCWDLFLWKNRKQLFVELKRFKKDRIQKSQIKWLDAAISLGLKPINFLLIEWDLEK